MRPARASARAIGTPLLPASPQLPAAMPARCRTPPPAPLALSWHRLRGGRLRHRAVPYPPTQGAPGIPQATSPNRGRGPTSPFPLVRWSRATAPTTSTGSRHPARPAHPRARGLPILGAEPARGRTRRHHGCPPSGTARAHAEGYGCVIARGGGRSRRGSALPGRPSRGVAAGSGRCARGRAPRVAPLPERGAVGMAQLLRAAPWSEGRPAAAPRAPARPVHPAPSRAAVRPARMRAMPGRATSRPGPGRPGPGRIGSGAAQGARLRTNGADRASDDGQARPRHIAPCAAPIMRGRRAHRPTGCARARCSPRAGRTGAPAANVVPARAAARPSQRRRVGAAALRRRCARG